MGGSSSLTPSEVALALAWAHSSSPRSPTPWWSPTTPPSLSTSWSRTLTRRTVSTTRRCTTSASGADPADVRCQEHDGRVRPKTRALSYCCCCVPRTHVNEGGGRADAEHPEQEQQLLRRVDPQQCQDCCL